jgi:hypothetical protein
LLKTINNTNETLLGATGFYKKIKPDHLSHQPRRSASELIDKSISLVVTANLPTINIVCIYKERIFIYNKMLKYNNIKSGK